MERVSNRRLLQFCKCRTDGVAVFALICIALLLAPSMRAQSRRPELPWAMSARIGAVGNAYENAYSYFKHSKGHDLITMTFVADAQHDFTDAFALRLSFAFGKNAGACNSEQAGGGFYPYVFSSSSVFTDAMLRVSKLGKDFTSKFYFGLGVAHTYNFEKEHNWSHAWESTHGDMPSVTYSNTVMGFRVGYLGEYHITPEVGLLVDIAGEMYFDKYNGLQPHSSDHARFEGYGGFPFDARGIISVGMAYHF